ncbi:hypothetical protein NL676_030900 [Syzygium grande]|nr:hypothetical protein NL676_030900 [Syzygium grande]
MEKEQSLGKANKGMHRFVSVSGSIEIDPVPDLKFLEPAVCSPVPEKIPGSRLGDEEERRISEEGDLKGCSWGRSQRPLDDAFNITTAPEFAPLFPPSLCFSGCSCF